MSKKHVKTNVPLHTLLAFLAVEGLISLYFIKHRDFAQWQSHLSVKKGY